MSAEPEAQLAQRDVVVDASHDHGPGRRSAASAGATISATAEPNAATVTGSAPPAGVEVVTALGEVEHAGPTLDLRGLWVPVVTPFNGCAGDLDVAGLRASLAACSTTARPVSSCSAPRARRRR